MSGWSCANEAQWVNDKTGPGRCAKWCGNRATCVSSIPGKALPAYEEEPFRHLWHAVTHLLSCWHGGEWDPEVKRLTLPLIAYRDRLYAEAKGEPPPAAAPSESVDWLGLALELEAQAKRVESQTAERAMLAAAHGLRLMGTNGVAAAPAPRREMREVPPGKWKVDMPDGTYGTMPGDPPGPASVRAVIGGYVYDVEPRTGRLTAENPPRGVSEGRHQVHDAKGTDAE